MTETTVTVTTVTLDDAETLHLLVMDADFFDAYSTRKLRNGIVAVFTEEDSAQDFRQNCLDAPNLKGKLVNLSIRTEEA